jgi:two-component system heavy metal sensor histidine kinase CusS
LKQTKKIRSIQSQLLFLYSIVIVCILTLAAIGFFWEEQNIVNRADYNFIADEVNDIQFIIAEKSNDMDLLKQKIITKPLRTHNSMYRYYIRVLDDENHVLLETPGMPEVLEAANSPEQKSDFMRIESPVIFKDRAQQGMVQVVLDTAYEHRITKDRRIFLGLLLAAIIVSLLIGRYVIRRGLRSLDTLTNTVEKIGSSSLDKRVDPKEFPPELSHLGSAFNQMLERIETSFARLKRLSADMSHELRTPVNNLIGQTELLLAYEHEPVDRRNMQASNLEELQRISSLIENILFLARAESKTVDFEKTMINAEDEISKIREYYEPLAEEKNIEITQYGSATLRVNVTMFDRLISNLLSNAIKYTPEFGKVSFTISDERDSAEIHIIDNGIGIADEHIHKLFDRFYRVDAARVMQQCGSGLGLAIAKSIVDQHHGTITVLSAVGCGTEIIISLPK